MAQFGAQFFLTWEAGLIPTGEDALIFLVQDILNNGIVLFRTEHHTYSRIIPRTCHFTVVIIHVHEHLPHIAMGQFAGLQFDYHVTLQLDVIKDEIRIKMVAIQRQAFLPSHKGKPLPKLQQEGLLLAYQRPLQIALI